MNRTIALRIMVALCVCALAGVLTACAGGATSAPQTEQQANRAYMSQINETMAELNDSLAQFNEATSNGDVVNMRVQADNAYKALDKLAAIEAPERMKDISDKYLEGTNKLRQALDGYIDLYTEAVAAGDNFDWSASEKRMSEIQKLYDEGVDALKDADADVAAQAADSSSSASA